MWVHKDVKFHVRPFTSCIANDSYRGVVSHRTNTFLRRRGAALSVGRLSLTTSLRTSI